MNRILVFGAGVVFEKFIQSGDAKDYDIVTVFDNHKSGEFLGFPVRKPERLADDSYDLIVLALWDKPEVVEAVTTQLTGLGYDTARIRVYSYDRHVLCELSNSRDAYSEVEDAQILYAYYDLNSNSETYDITSFLAIADCYREQQGLLHLHPVIVARDASWSAQAYCLEQQERMWRAENIVKQACDLVPSVRGMTYCSTREQAGDYLTRHTNRFPANYHLDCPPPISVHRDFYYWLDLGFDPRRFKASIKARHYIQLWIDNTLPLPARRYLCVTLRESTLQPKRNSDVAEWNRFFLWLQAHHPDLSVVVIRDTEEVFSVSPFSAQNVFIFSPASFHMHLRMALYEMAYLNMGCSNGPKQLCHLSQSISYITNKMIVEDYQGSSSARFLDRNIEIGKNFRFADDNQIIDWRTDSYENLVDSFVRFESKFPIVQMDSMSG